MQSYLKRTAFFLMIFLLMIQFSVVYTPAMFIMVLDPLSGGSEVNNSISENTNELIAETLNPRALGHGEVAQEDLIIDTDTVWERQTRTITTNIIVTGSATLTMKHTSLLFNGTESIGILLEDQTKLKLHNSILASVQGNSVITCKDASDVELTNSTIENLITVGNSRVSVVNCIFNVTN